MFHHSNVYKSKAIHPKIPKELLSLKGQTGNRKCQSFPVKTKEEEQRKFDYDLHKAINRKKKKHTNDLKAFCPLGCSLFSNSR